MASGSPRKRRLGRLYDLMYGDNSRGSHYSSQMFASRSADEQRTDLTSYVQSRKAAFLTSSMDFSSSVANQRLVKIDNVGSIYDNGSGSYGFACWMKMVSASAPMPVALFSFGGDTGTDKFFSFGLETSGSGYQVQNQWDSGSNGPFSSSLTELHFAAGGWQFLSYTENRTGDLRHFTASLNATTFASGTYTAFSGTFNSASLGIIRSGSAAGNGVNNLLGRVHQAAFWTSLKTNEEFTTVYNGGVSDNWMKHSPQYYWTLGVSDGTTVDAMSGSAGTVVSGTLRVDSP